MKIGVKSELHSCTIVVIKLLEKERILDFKFSGVLEYDKELRIDNQYYLKNRPVEFDARKLSELLLKVKEVLDSLSNTQIQKIRKVIAEA